MGLEQGGPGLAEAAAVPVTAIALVKPLHSLATTSIWLSGRLLGQRRLLLPEA